jgi:hypothetical protein
LQIREAFERALGIGPERRFSDGPGVHDFAVMDELTKATQPALKVLQVSSDAGRRRSPIPCTEDFHRLSGPFDPFQG